MFVCMRALTTFHVPALTCTEERARKRERLLKSLEAIEVEHEHHTNHREHEREARQECQVCLRELDALFFLISVRAALCTCCSQGLHLICPYSLSRPHASDGTISQCPPSPKKATTDAQTCKRRSGVKMTSRGDKNDAEDQEKAGVFSQWPLVAGMYVLQRDVDTSTQARFAYAHRAIRQIYQSSSLRRSLPHAHK